MKESVSHTIWSGLGARFTQANAYCAVDHFGDPESEYWAVKRQAGAFDMSALQKFKALGSDADSFLDNVLTRNIASASNGQAFYSPMCNNEGGLVTDCIVFHLGPDDWLLVCGEGSVEPWLAAHARGMQVTVENVTGTWFCLAVQGPRSRDILHNIVETRLDDLEYYRFVMTGLAGIQVLLSRTGHTGELGYEIFGPMEHAKAVWEAVAKSGERYGLIPCGFSALDSLRIDAGLWFYGRDADATTSPYHLRLDWSVDLGKAEFVGKVALGRISRDGPAEQLVGLELDRVESPSPGARVYDGTGEVGRITSASWSPAMQKSIALALVAVRATRPGNALMVDLGDGSTSNAYVVRLPFSDPLKRRRRGITYKTPRPRSTTGIYRRLGVKKIINGVGTWAITGGSLLAREVIEAMREASQCFVDITELQRRCAERVADLTGAEAAHICSGGSAGLALSAAACMVGTDIGKIQQLPRIEGVQKYEIVTFRSHRNGFDQGLRQSGAQLREIGYLWETLPWHLEEAINEHTAAIHYDIFSHMMVPPASLRLEEVLQIGHRHGVPVILDTAGELPPPENLAEFPAMGVDLTIFSGGKGIMGPQGAGLVLGRKALVEAVALNGNPNYAIGRAMKVDKEEMVGMVRALELYLARDHQADQERWSKQTRYLVEHLSGIPGFQVFAEPKAPHGRPIPQVYISWDQKALGMRVEQAIAYLASLDPSVWVSKHLNYLRINPHMMPEGDEVIMAEMVRQFSEGVAKGSIFIPPGIYEWLPLSATKPYMV